MVRLKQPTRDGDSEIAIFTNLPQTDAPAYRGMQIALEPSSWHSWRDAAPACVAQQLLLLATRVNLKIFLKQPRGSKRQKPPLIVDRRHRHLSTQRLLNPYHRSP
ncbi:hypothetical protein CKA32_006381 [Geitlerinema sp. FC II]|nr:hypothetical protein CKA32_006381 [Geitlerinema sp. FC II]